jgi:hypothetical protein
MPYRPPRPRDPNQLAHLLVQIASGQTTDPEPPKRDALAVELGRRGGLKGGKARKKKLSKERRSEIAREAVMARWSKEKSRKN